MSHVQPPAVAPRTALVVGSRGQDGRLLGQLLGERGYRWLGLARGAVDNGGLPWTGAVDVGDPAQVERLVGELQPDEVYHLAAHHHSAESAASGEADLLRRSLEVNVGTLGNFLEAIRRLSPRTRLFYAASSHVFGNPSVAPQDEDTPLRPTTAYGISKAAGVLACRASREAHGVFAAAGILYNHESALRPPQFLSSRLVDGALGVKRGTQSEVVVARLGAEADWGYAPDYVDAMQRILQLEQAGDFVVATGRLHSVREFADAVFAALGLDWRRHVREDASADVRAHARLVGDPRKVEAATGWRAGTDLRRLAELLVRDRAAAGVAAR